MPGMKPKFLGSDGYESGGVGAAGVEEAVDSRSLAAWRCNIFRFHSGMSSSVFDTCCCGVDEEGPEVLVVLDVKALPISAPIRDLCAPCPVDDS